MNEIELITRAGAFAVKAHGTQKRKESELPYVIHLFRVAEAAAGVGLSVEAVAAALLHDTVEDTKVTLEELSNGFPARVVHLVRLLTKTWADDAPKELIRTEKVKYYAGILSDPEAIELKLLDRADNLRDMTEVVDLAPRWAERYFEKTSVEVAPILEQSRNDRVRRAYEEALEALSGALRGKSPPR